MLKHRVNVGLTVANIIGLAAYLGAASLTWVRPEERKLGYLAEPYLWVLGALRILALFLLINLAWGIAMLARAQWRNGRLFASIWLFWIIAFVFDYSRH